MCGVCGPASLLFNTCLCTCCFNCVKKVSGQSDHRARIFGYYIIFFLYYGLGTLIMYTFGNSFMSWFENWIKCPKFGEASCFGASLILRISFSLLILYVLVWLLMLPKDDFSFKANKNCWIVKYLLPLFLTIIWFFIGNDFFVGYARVSQYGGIIYLIFQDLAYNEYFIRWSVNMGIKARGTVCYVIIYWLMVAFFNTGTIIFLILDFNHNFNCSDGKGITIANIILIAITTGLTFFKSRNDIGFLSTAVYNCYITYYLYSGISSDTNLQCTSLNRSSGWILSEILINLAIITIIFITMSFSMSIPVFGIRKADELTPEYFQNPELHDGTRQHEAGALRGGADAQESLDHLEYRTLKYVWLFLCYIFLTMHFLSILTNYGTVSLYKGETWYLYNGQSGYYIKVINGFIAALIYLWTLLAPWILRGRKFGYEEDPQTGEITVAKPQSQTASMAAPRPASSAAAGP